MPDMLNILLKDDTNTDLTFSPQDSNGAANIWRADVTGDPLEGQPRITATYEKLKSGDWKVTHKLEVPAMETVGTASSGYTAAPKVAYANVAILSFFLSRRSTKAERANLGRMAAHLLAGAGSSTGQYIDVGAGASGVYAAVVDSRPCAYGIVNVRKPV